MTSFNDLYQFVDSAVKSRKYLPNTASGLKAALKTFGEELNNEELKSIQKVRDNIDQIHQIVYQKQKSKYSASSLNVYKSRVMKVIGDYEKYGTDPAKMAGWIVKIISREHKKKANENIVAPVSDLPRGEVATLPQENGYNRVNVSLNGRNFLCVVPADMTPEEFKKLSAMLGF